MIEEVLLDYLGQALEHPVYPEYPEDAPESFFICRKGDGSREDWIHTDLFTVESYGSSAYQTAVLNAQAVEAMDAATDLDQISGSRYMTDYPFYDTTHKRYRYQAVYEISY